MAATPHDPHNLREIAATVVLGYRINRRLEKGKPTGRLEREVDRIREKAQEREDQRGKKK